MPALMPLPAKITFVTFDVYGTLIGWGSGGYGAFRREAARDGFTIDDRDEIIPRFHEYEREVEGGSYELYAEVLRRVAGRIAKELGCPPPPAPPRVLAAAPAPPSPTPAPSAPGCPYFKGIEPAAQEARPQVPDGADLEHRRQAPR